MIFRYLFKDKFNERKKIESYKLDPNCALEAQNINYSFDEKKVVNNFNFKFYKGKIYTIVGGVGSGKSVLASHFNGLVKSDTANIYLFNGQNIYSFNKKITNFKEIRKAVGMVLQNPEYQLFKETVVEDVCCGLKMLRPDEPNPEEIAKEKLSKLGIRSEFFYRNPFTLSGGQKKKVALAGIFSINPEIIIFDEPLLGLDPYSCNQIIEIITDLKKQGKTVIVISNNIDLLLEIGDEMLVMDRGRLIMSGNPYSIFRDKRINLGIPKIIEFIERLEKSSSRFKSLWNYEPKNYEELSQAILNVIRE